MQIAEEIRQKSCDVILELLPNASAEQLLDDSDIFGLGLDSINVMSLILNLQSTFGVQFEASDINFENFRTVESIVKLVKEKLET